MIKTRIMKLKSIENEEIIMAMAMTKIIITTAIMKIIIISKYKVFCFQANVIISCGQSTLAVLKYKSDWGNKTNKIKRKSKLKLTRTKLITTIE